MQDASHSRAYCMGVGGHTYHNATNETKAQLTDVTRLEPTRHIRHQTKERIHFIPRLTRTHKDWSTKSHFTNIYDAVV